MLTLLLALAVTAPADTIPALWTPHRVYDAKHKRYADLEQMAAEAASSDVIFFGEQHDDGNAHRLDEWITPDLLPQGLRRLIGLTQWSAAWLATNG